MTARPYISLALWRWGALLALLFAACATYANGLEAGIDVGRGDISERQGVYYLDARVHVGLNGVVQEALESGVPLTFVLEIQVERPRLWLWSENVAALTQRYQLRYHALSGRYVLTNLNSGESRSYIGQQTALDALGRIDNLPLIDAGLLGRNEEYEVWVRARLDIDELPRPLRTVAYISPEWRLVSDWQIWRIRV